jgi:hypothetical protein
VSQQINLYNPIFQKQKQYFSVAAMLQSLALIAIGSAVFYGYAVYQVKQLTRQSDETAKRYTAEQAKLASITAEFSPQKSNELLMAEVKRLEAKSAAQNELIDTLKSGVIGNTTGYSEYMRAFARQTVSGLWLTGFNIVGSGAQMSMSGAVLSPELVAAYIQKLSREEVMRGKSFAELQMQQPKADSAKAVHYVEFTLQSVETAGTAKQ